MKNRKPVIGVGAVVISRNRLLLVKRKNEPGKGFWSIPGGKVKFGESLTTAVERELLEETGVKIRVQEPVHVFDVIQKNNDIHYVVIDYRAEFISGELSAADDAEEAGWFSNEEVNKLNLHAETRKLVEEKLDF